MNRGRVCGDPQARCHQEHAYNQFKMVSTYSMEANTPPGYFCFSDRVPGDEAISSNWITWLFKEEDRRFIRINSTKTAEMLFAFKFRNVSTNETNYLSTTSNESTVVLPYGAE